MITDPKRLGDMGFNVAIMGSFAIPGAGAAIAAGFAVGQFFFDMFCPNAQDVPTQDASPTDATLNAAIDDMSKKLIAAILQVHTSVDVTDTVLTQNTKFWNFWSRLQNIDLGKSSEPIGIDSDTETEYESYFNTGAGDCALDLLRTARNNVAITSTVEYLIDPVDRAYLHTRTTGLYCLIGSLIVSYLKARVIWRWGKKVRTYRGYQKYLAAHEAWKAQPQAYKDKNEEPKWTLTETPKQPPDWNAFRASDEVKLLKDEITNQLDYSLGDGTAANPGLYTTMAKNWKQRPQTIYDRVGKLSLQTDGTYHWYKDSDQGDLSPKVENKDLAAIHMETKRGALIAYLWKYWSIAYALEGVVEDDMAKFRDTINAWRATATSVQFQTYTVEDGDMLIPIAEAFYGKGNGDLYHKIVDANPDVIKDPNVIGTGWVLKIPDLKPLGSDMPTPDFAWTRPT